MGKIELLNKVKKAIMLEDDGQAIDLINQVIKAEEALEQREGMTVEIPCAEELMDVGENGKNITIQGDEVHVTINFFTKED